jgi:hypothetical protein
VRQIQGHLESLYGLERKLQARDFLIDKQSCDLLGVAVRAREEVLVCEGESGVELGVYFDRQLLAQVGSQTASQALHQRPNSFCEVVEGVSHFLYLSQAADLDRHVSLLELETQAEVDKFALIASLECSPRFQQFSSSADALARWRKHRGTAVLEQLFQRVVFHKHLTNEETARYREANRLAKVYCAQTLLRALRGGFEYFVSELRKVYRLGSDAKLRYFALAT